MNVPELDRPSCQRIEAALIRRHWGKARPVVGQPAWHPLMCHSLDVAAVGQAYLQAHQSLAAWLASAGGFPSVDALVRWMVFWLVLHDLGKFSLSFQCQRIDLVRQNTGGEPPHAGQPEVRHDTLGYLLWTGHVAPTIDEQGWWGDRGDWQDGAAHWARAFTGHHGQPPVEGMRDLRPHFSGADLSAALALVRWADASFIDAELRSFLAQAGEAFETEPPRLLRRLLRLRMEPRCGSPRSFHPR